MARIREAIKSDVPVLMEMIRAAADFHAPDFGEKEGAALIEATEDRLKMTLFIPCPFARILVAEAEQTGAEPVAVGFAAYYFTYSTYKARPSLYLEDLFVFEEHRGGGLGTALLKQLTQVALEHGCSTIEWTTSSGDGNAAMEFYRRTQAEVVDTTHDGKFLRMRLQVAGTAAKR